MVIAPVLIVGMHRSGTSSLAGSLQQAGLELGRVSERAPHNRKGNRENRSFVVLNNEVLRDNAAGWNKPPKRVAIWSAERKTQRDELLDASQQDRPWGFKDPRTLLTIEGWLEATPDARIVGTFRHPVAVALSLEGRSGFPFDKGIALWSDYNQRLLRLTRARDVPLICFDWSPARYMARIDTISEALGLRDRAADDAPFFDAGLRSSAATPRSSDHPGAMALYADLLTLAISQDEVAANRR